MIIVIASVITAVALATGILAIFMVRKREKGEKKKAITEGCLKENYGLVGDAHADIASHRQVSLLDMSSVAKMRALGVEVPHVPVDVAFSEALRRDRAHELPAIRPLEAPAGHTEVWRSKSHRQNAAKPTGTPGCPSELCTGTIDQNLVGIQNTAVEDPARVLRKEIDGPSLMRYRSARTRREFNLIGMDRTPA